MAMLWCFLMDHIFFFFLKTVICHRTERKEEKVLSLQTDLLIFWGENSISFP